MTWHNEVMMKEIGLGAELRFNCEAVERGLMVSIPCGEQIYDCIVDSGDNLFRVQVKSTSKERFDKKDKFRVLLTSGNAKRPYTSKEIDVFAIYIIPLKIWYFVPQSMVDGRIHLSMHPSSKTCPVSQYRDAWEIFFKSSKVDSQLSG